MSQRLFITDSGVDDKIDVCLVFPVSPTYHGSPALNLWQIQNLGCRRPSRENANIVSPVDQTSMRQTSSDIGFGEIPDILLLPSPNITKSMSSAEIACPTKPSVLNA